MADRESSPTRRQSFRFPLHWKFANPGTATLFSWNHIPPRVLDIADLDAGVGDVALISDGDDGYTIDTTSDTVLKLIDVWAIPIDAAEYMWNNRHPWGMYTAENSDRNCLWYHFPILLKTQGLTGSSINVCQIMERKTSRVRLLVFCSGFVRSEVARAFQTVCDSPNPSEPLGMKCFMIHPLLAEIAHNTWKEGFILMSSEYDMVHHDIVISSQRTLDATILVRCNITFEGVLFFIGGMQVYQVSLQRVQEHLERQENLSACHRQVMSNLLNQSDGIIAHCRHFKEVLHCLRHTLVHSIDIQNASYVRGNTIALRRLAQQAQAEAQQARKLSELSQKNSESTAKISYVTMFFLPPTFVATFFSMPFLQLNGDKQFSAFDKIWVYVLTAAIATALTFLFSSAWDRLLYGLKGSAHPDGGSEKGEMAWPDAEILEPAPFVALTHDELYREYLEHERNLRRGLSEEAKLEDTVETGTSEEDGETLEEAEDSETKGAT